MVNSVREIVARACEGRYPKMFGEHGPPPPIPPPALQNPEPVVSTEAEGGSKPAPDTKVRTVGKSGPHCRHTILEIYVHPCLTCNRFCNCGFTYFPATKYPDIVVRSLDGHLVQLSGDLVRASDTLRPIVEKWAFGKKLEEVKVVFERGQNGDFNFILKYRRADEERMAVDGTGEVQGGTDGGDTEPEVREQARQPVPLPTIPIRKSARNFTKMKVEMKKMKEKEKESKEAETKKMKEKEEESKEAEKKKMKEKEKDSKEAETNKMKEKEKASKADLPGPSVSTVTLSAPDPPPPSLITAKKKGRVRFVYIKFEMPPLFKGREFTHPRLNSFELQDEESSTPVADLIELNERNSKVLALFDRNSNQPTLGVCKDTLLKIQYFVNMHLDDVERKVDALNRLFHFQDTSKFSTTLFKTYWDMKLSNSFAYEDWEEDFFNQMDIGSFHDLQQANSEIQIWDLFESLEKWVMLNRGFPREMVNGFLDVVDEELEDFDPNDKRAAMFALPMVNYPNPYRTSFHLCGKEYPQKLPVINFRPVWFRITEPL